MDRVSLKDKLTKMHEQILETKRGAAQWVMTRHEEIDDFLASRVQINDVLVPVKKQTVGEKMVGMPVACIRTSKR